MSLMWKPTLLVAMAMILFGALYFKHPTASNGGTTDSKAAAASVPADIMKSAGRLPETVVDNYQ